MQIQNERVKYTINVILHPIIINSSRQNIWMKHEFKNLSHFSDRQYR